MEQNVPVREQIRRFLTAAAVGDLPINTEYPNGPKQAPANNADILRLYSPDMEVQVNVVAGDGQPIEGRKNTWEHDGQEYWHIRCPKGAMDNPNWQDYHLRWSLIEHAEAVGMTGWDWANRRSRWVAFDFDAITGHAPGVGVTDERLQAIREAAFDIPYVQVRKSTRGGGYHLYVYFCDWQDTDTGGHWLGDGIPCENHTIHQALARCILAKMSQEANFNFASAIDACGGNMWIWHLDANKANEGLSMVKDNSALLDVNDLPPNWRDHVDVVLRKRTKIKIRGVPDSEDGDFDALVSGRNMVPLDERHNQMIERLGEANFTTIWVPEYNLLQTHTCAFARVQEEHPDQYIGFFETNSDGNNPGEPNCFCFPLPNGAWRLVRFSKGIREHETWEQNGKDWTGCYFNVRPSLETAALSMGGAEMSEGGFEFETLGRARKAILALGGEINVPETWNDRECRLRRSKNGRLIVMIRKHKGEPKPNFGWIEKRDWWECVFKIDTESRDHEEYETPEFDKYIRALVTPGGEMAGWAVKKSHKENWDITPTGVVKLFLNGKRFSQTEANEIMGVVYANRWDLVNMPFQPEFPGDRQWNYKSPQLRYPPARLEDDEVPEHPFWDRVLDHVGGDLNEALPDHKWASRYGIKTGRQYLQLWIACMIRESFEPLPYLFLWGPENSGKSIFHEAISKLMTGGIAYADKALTTSSDFNGELANAVLAVVEETDVAQAGDRARNRMKDWVTAEYLFIRRMRTDGYLQKNTLHFVQCSNNSDACLVQYGDTRTTMLYVPALLGDEIPKSVLKRKLEKEAPHFMATLMALEIPPVEGRLRIPYVTTSSKTHMEQQNLNSLRRYIEENTYNINGAAIKFADFYAKFQNWLPEEERGYWTNRRVTRSLPMTYPTGQATGGGDTHIGNIAWDTKVEEKEMLVLYDRRLRFKSDASTREKKKNEDD